MSPISSSSPTLAERLEVVRAGIAAAALEAGRGVDEITTIVVTKFHPASLVRELYALGVREVGENRHQEAQAKAAELADLDLGWNFIGQLQSKKAKQVRAYAHSVHSLDRTSVIEALGSEHGASVECFVQLNLTDDPGRGGIRDAELEQTTELVLATPGLELLGVMAVAPVGEDPRPAFVRVREASERMRRLAPDARFISAGMSGDYREAILEGATHLRIGSAITGNRPTPG
ncbi:YggS family pyridoxal phosphate-dependent enzyme [Glaciihabitans sp. INWT7]|uniref:YggS family pyridoxal phosphate-dependent enzyme n=1 Tax=Glaciihabitans sp. INWT7 TaxID=2596912 RepID=UPI0021051D33|nr:YggS family pyridoxal phosphate-dependent enzyme [Glaciihabitans sp. INWT7]